MGTGFDSVFLDTAPIIYFLQKNKLHFEQTKDILRYLRQIGALFVSSDITIEEYLVMPYRENNLLLTVAFDRFIMLAQYVNIALLCSISAGIGAE